MDIVSVNETIVTDVSIQDNADTNYENEALEVQTGDEIIHGHKLIGSQSSIEYDKSGDSKRRGTGPRSKSFLEEPSHSKAALFMQRRPGDKGLRSTHGSHGDGICLWPSWDICKGITGSESTDKGPDQEKKLQIVLTDPATQSAAVTQKLFETNVTFADLVRVYATQENHIQNCKFQLGNTLLSTVHASTLVSNYLNTYRSYLDYLRKTCGRGNSQEKLSSPRAPPKSVPLFLPLAGMTSVFSDDSREDPEFVELLKKTTTESIRKLWPHSNKCNIVRNAGLIDTKDNEDEEVVVGNNTDQQTEPGNTETYIDTPLKQFIDIDDCESKQDNNNKTNTSNSEKVKLSPYTYICDSQFTPQEDSNVSTNNPNYTMKFTSDTVLVEDGDSSHVQNMNSVQVQKGMLKVQNDSQTCASSLYKLATESVNQQSNPSCLTNWSDINQQKCVSDSDNHLPRPATLDTLLQQQQKLVQQQQYQRQQMIQQQEIQQQRQQQQQQQQQQHQLLQQYQQQEQQRQQSKQLPTNKSHGYQSISDTSKSWLQVVGDGTGISQRNCLSANSQPTSIYKTEPIMSQQMSLDSYGNNYQTNSDYFASHTAQSMTTRPTHLDSQAGLSETSTQPRTLKASYACLDPSNPMTLSVDPLRDYNEDDFLSQCDLPMFDRQSFSNLPSSFGTCFDDRSNSSELNKMWGKASRPVTSFNEYNDYGKSLEERLRKAYARSRMTQFPQQGQWNDASRLCIQRPIVKMNTMADGSDNNQSYNFQGQRGLVDCSSRKMPNHGNNCSGQQDKWNRLMCCSETIDAGTNDGLIANSAGMREDSGSISYMPLQPSTSGDINSGMSRLYQWKQETMSPIDSSYFHSSRSQNNMSNYSTNENTAGHSLLYGLQWDRDFSWNASSMSVQNSSFQGCDQQGVAGDNGHSKLSAASNLVKHNTLTSDQRRQLLNNNNASLLQHRHQSEQVNDSSLFYDGGEVKNNSWSLKSKQDESDKQGVSGINSLSCGPVLSPSMHILNKKILAAQSHSKNQTLDGSLGNTGSDGGSPNGKDGDKILSGTSTPSSTDSQSTENRSRLRLARGYSEANKVMSQRTISLSQLTAMHHPQQSRETVDTSVFTLSEELEKTFLDDPPNSTPWHELASQENIDNAFNLIDTKCERDKYNKMQNFSGQSMMFNDSSIGVVRSNDTTRIYDNQNKLKDQGLQVSMESQIGSLQQEPSSSRMVGSAKSVKQVDDDKIKLDVEESNRRLRQMLGLAPTKEQNTSGAAPGMRLQEGSQMPPQTSSPGLMLIDQTTGQPYNKNSSPVPTSQLPRMQLASGKIQTPVGLTQQMYCVPNILMPPPAIQSQNSSRQSNIIPIQGVMTNMASGTRFPQGMIRVPFVDMSRLVYVHQMPVGMTSNLPNNNNHNNSSSSNPHVNTSNIITINTSDNDFSTGGLVDKSIRHVRATPGKTKTTFLKMRSGSDEFSVPILGIRPPIDESMCPRLVKSRTNPWDQDLDHDFSNSLMSKTVSVENITAGCTPSSTTDPSFGSSELGVLFSDGKNLQGSNQMSLDPAAKTATFMQWPASADMHPEMLDMLPVRRAIPDECNSGRLCWPEMEFLMSSREQLQSARRSNKPMGSNKANLISIIPKENIIEGNLCVKEVRYEKIDNKLT